ARPRRGARIHLRDHRERVAIARRRRASPTTRSEVRGRGVGAHDRAVGARHRRVPRRGAAARLVHVRGDRHASSRIAGSAAERPRQRRVAQARRRAGRDSSPLAAVGRRPFRSGPVVAAEGRLGRSVGLDGRASPLMHELPRSARVYVGSVIAIGLTLLVFRLPEARFAQPVLFVALLVLSSMSAALKVYLPLTTTGSTMSLPSPLDSPPLLLLLP